MTHIKLDYEISEAYSKLSLCDFFNKNSCKNKVLKNIYKNYEL